MAVLSIRSVQMARSVRFGLRMANFILPCKRSLSAAKPSNFYQGLAVYEGRPAAVTVLSKPMAVLPRPASINSSFSNSGRAAMAVLSPRSGRMARSLDLGCGWPISYCPAQAVYQRPSRAIFERAGEASGRFIRPASRSGRFIKAGQPQSQFLEQRPALSRPRTRPVAAMAVLSTRSGQMARSLDLSCGWPIPYCPIQAVYQRPNQAILRKSWQSERTASKASYKASYEASYKASQASYKASSKASHKASSKASYKEP